MLTSMHHRICVPAAGNLKNAIMTIVGAFAFGDFIFEPWNAAGLAVSMAGAVWYAMRSALRVSLPVGITQGCMQGWSPRRGRWVRWVFPEGMAL